MPWIPAKDKGNFGHPYLRWTVLFGLSILLITTLPIWLSFVIPNYIVYVNSLAIGLFSLIWVIIAFNAVINFSKLDQVVIPNLTSLNARRQRKFTHIVVVPCYLDPIDVLFDCLGSLLLQHEPQNLFVVIAFEAKTPDLMAKEDSVRRAFHDKFGHFLIVIHTVNPKKEIAGGCSNKNYALRKASKYLNDYNETFKWNDITVTTCDTDSLFHPNYFEALEHAYNIRNPDVSKPIKFCVWQSPLFYNWDLDKRPFFNRITGIMRSMMMLGGLISFNLNPMSIFSYPLELGRISGFINPRYGVDDIISKVRWMCETNESIPVVLLPVPSISGPTIGTSWMLEVDEWARQIRRWVVGSSESFHYFCIHWKGLPFFSGLVWLVMFYLYYAVLLCSAGLFTILSSIPLFWVTDAASSPMINIDIPYVLSYSFSLSLVPLASLFIQYLVFAIAFVIDRRAVSMMGITEEIGIVRNVIHWLLAPPTLLVYSLIAFYSILLFIVEGKKLAKHDMASKEGIVAITGIAANFVSDRDLQKPLMRESSLTSGNGDSGNVEGGGEIVGDEEEDADFEADGAISPSQARNLKKRNTSVARYSVDNQFTSLSGKRTAIEAGVCQLPDRFFFGGYHQEVVKSSSTSQ